MATGMNAATGEPLSGLDHLRQSITDILTTRIGTRVMRRDYGSDIPNLVDRPIDDGLRVDIYAAAALALKTWEPRLDVVQMDVVSVGEGVVELSLTAKYLPDGKTLRLERIILR